MYIIFNTDSSIRFIQFGRFSEHQDHHFQMIWLTMVASNDLSRLNNFYEKSSLKWSDLFVNEGRGRTSNDTLAHLNESPYSISVHWISHGNNILISILFISFRPRTLKAKRSEWWKC